MHEKNLILYHLHENTNIKLWLFLVLDLEMTGPEPDYNEIIQIGAVLFDDQWVERGALPHKTSIPKMKRPSPPRRRRFITCRWLICRDAPMMYDVLPELEEWICSQLGMQVPKGTGGPNAVFARCDYLRAERYQRHQFPEGSVSLRETQMALLPRTA